MQIFLDLGHSMIYSVEPPVSCRAAGLVSTYPSKGTIPEISVKSNFIGPIDLTEYQNGQMIFFTKSIVNTIHT